MGGLNEGFELDHELGDGEDKIVELMFDNTAPGETPKLSEDVDIVAVVKDKVTDLNYLRQDIRRAGGMNKTFALEAERLIPGFLNEDRPIGYFTLEPTQTQYRDTMLALEAFEKSLIAELDADKQELIKQHFNSSQ